MSQHIVPNASTLGATWVKARKSGGDGDCVEFAQVPQGVAVRHSKAPNGPALVFTPSEIAAWVDGARNGEWEAFTA